MDLQDKIGKELARNFLDDLVKVHEWVPVKVDIFKNTSTYKFFANTPEFRRNHKGKRLYGMYKAERTRETALRIVPYEIDLLLHTGFINKDQHSNLFTMLNGNELDYNMAIMSINQLRNKRIKYGQRGSKK